MLDKAAHKVQGNDYYQDCLHSNAYSQQGFPASDHVDIWQSPSSSVTHTHTLTHTVTHNVENMQMYVSCLLFSNHIA
jgi:hypothetical protein